MAGNWQLIGELEFSNRIDLRTAVGWFAQNHEDELRNLVTFDLEFELHFCLAIADYQTAATVRDEIESHFGSGVRFVDFAFVRED